MKIWRLPPDQRTVRWKEELCIIDEETNNEMRKILRDNRWILEELNEVFGALGS